MRQIPMSSSLLTFLDDLEFTEAALSADPMTAHLAPPFAEEIHDWNAVFQKERAARRSVTRAQAAVVVRDAQLDFLTSRFGGAVLLEANQNRRGPIFQKFFPVAPSEFIRQGLRKQCELTRDRLLPELTKLGESSPLFPHAASLSAAVDAALVALEARSKARGENSSAGNDVDEWKEGVNRLRNTSHAELLKIAAEKNLGKSWAETFFRRESNAETDASPEPQPL